ncbi:MAG: bifunctional demethylmenaquinone methyltransferase/2-methoxy-6-polyprenyl-1,4-benzoquinol methylase UbiE [Ignavibacteriales bacterium]|nr:MAG: bifunctional demethylmenaquinone methyltransferase/2-methoxy-6-polyprenyl-1,4-benzoquinol methylase UbiE [Ignavibacteriales bacterium]
MSEKKKQVKRIFDSIAYRYDFLNHLLSFGTDYYWRRKAIKYSGMNENSILLDVACGTGDFAITAHNAGVKNIYGADLSYKMLKLFNSKAEWIKGCSVEMVAEFLPFKDSSFTNITVAFGVRNFYDIPKAFSSFRSVLKPNGKVTILEFRLPKNIFFKVLYKFYFTRILPLIGNLISRDKEAYIYLPESVHEFDEKINLKELLEQADFSKVDTKSLTFGIVQVVIATK